MCPGLGVSVGALPPQGTPLKYDTASSSAGKKHDVRSIIGSPGRTFPPVHPLDVMADARALERACYEESLKGRPGAVGGSGGSITRGAPVIVPELGKPRQSPLTYEDHGAPFASHLPRGSPVTTREPTPRLQEGESGWRGGGALASGPLHVLTPLPFQSVPHWPLPIPQPLFKCHVLGRLLTPLPFRFWSHPVALDVSL